MFFAFFAVKSLTELLTAKGAKKGRKERKEKLAPGITIRVLCASNHLEIPVKVRLSKRIMQLSKPDLAGNG
jgi:hypothetical protein